MNCRFCGTALPGDAQFCGECGRPVVPVASAAPVRPRPPMPAVVFSAEPEGEPAARSVALAESEYSCPQCGEPIADDDVFCGECGFVLTSSYLSAPVDAVGEVRAVEEAGDVPEVLGAPRDAASRPEVALEPASMPDAVPEPAPLPEAAVDPEVALPASRPDDDPVATAGLVTTADPAPRATAAAPRTLRSVPDPFPWGKDSRGPTVDLEATRMSAAPAAEERFVLQFSTGESITVSGAGLVGRNPASQPGEYVDQLVTIFDAGKSVSKTHLEFGQDGGRFWVSDRYSTNGSTVRQPDAEPKRCEPGRRYFVARGTRVDIGDQFFVVS